MLFVKSKALSAKIKRYRSKGYRSLKASIFKTSIYFYASDYFSQTL